MRPAALPPRRDATTATVRNRFWGTCSRAAAPRLCCRLTAGPATSVDNTIPAKRCHFCLSLESCAIVVFPVESEPSTVSQPFVRAHLTGPEARFPCGTYRRGTHIVICA